MWGWIRNPFITVMTHIDIFITIQFQQDIGELSVDDVNLRMLQKVFLNPEVLPSAIGGNLLGQYVYYPIWLIQILFYCHNCKSFVSSRWQRYDLIFQLSTHFGFKMNKSEPIQQ